MAKNKKAPKEEIIPEGMKKSDYADAAFRKKVTIINLCIVAVFTIGIIAVIVAGWYNTKLEDELFEQIEQAFIAERDSVKAALDKIEDDGGSHDDKSKVKIEVTDDTFYYWISTLDASYQGDREAEDYAAYGGAEIHLQGMFYTKKFDGGAVQYWVYRNHSHDDKEHSHDHEHKEGAVDVGEMIPIEVIFQDEIDAPADGTWVDVKGIVGPDSTKNLSGIRYAEMTIMDEPGQEYVE